MSAPRTVLGLGSARHGWLRRVTEWAVSGALRLDFVKCVSAEDVLARLQNHQSDLGGGDTSSRAIAPCLLIEADIARRHPQVVAAATQTAATLILIGDPAYDSEQIPSSAIWLDFSFSHSDLASALEELPASPPRDPLLGVATTQPPSTGPGSSELGPSRLSTDRLNSSDLGSANGNGSKGMLVAVIGRAGSGVSTTAIALAQGLSDRLTSNQHRSRQFGTSQPATSSAKPDSVSPVLLADLSRYSDQALLHDSPDIVPGIQELVDEQATQANTDSVVGSHHLSFHVSARGYDLLLGLRRRRDWTALRPGPFQESLSAMRHDYQVVVADLDDDLEGKAETGSSDIQNRNLAARETALAADAVLAVGAASLVGVRSLMQLIDDLRTLGVEPRRLRPLVSRQPTRTSSNHFQAVEQLLGSSSNLVTASRSPEHRHTDDAHRNGTRLPHQLVSAAMSAISDLVAV